MSTPAPTGTMFSAARTRSSPFVAAAMFAVGFVGLDRPGMWADELATWASVRLSWPDLWHLLGNTDAVNGGYYVLLKPWTALVGTSETALRFPALLAMSAAAGLTVATGDRLARAWPGLGRWTGPVAGVLFAVLPATSRYAQEARAYALVIALSVLATYLLVRAVTSPRRSWLVGYAVTVAAIGVFHLLALLVLAGHLVIVLVWRRGLGWWPAASGAALAAVAPLAVLGMNQIGQTAWIDPISVSGVLSFPEALFGSRSVTVVMLALVVISVSRHRDRVTVLLLGWALAPAAALLAVALVTDLWFPRYLLFTVPAWTLLAGRAVVGPVPGIARALRRVPRHRLAPGVAAALLCLIMAVGAMAHWDIRRPNGHGHDTRGVAAIIAENYLPGDGLVVNLTEPVVPWEARDLVAAYLPAGSRPTDVFAVSGQREDGRLPAIESPDPAARLAGVDRVWVIRYENPPDVLQDIGGDKETYLRSHYAVAEHWQLRGLSVALLRRM